MPTSPFHRCQPIAVTDCPGTVRPRAPRHAFAGKPLACAIPFLLAALLCAACLACSPAALASDTSTSPASPSDDGAHTSAVEKASKQVVDVLLETASDLEKSASGGKAGSAGAAGLAGSTSTAGSASAAGALESAGAPSTAGLAGSVGAAGSTSTPASASATSSAGTSSLVGTAASALAATVNCTATDPVDAALSLDEATLTYRVDPGLPGTKLDEQALAATARTALDSGADLVRVADAIDLLVPQQVAPDDAGLVSACATANTYLSCNLQLTVNGSVVATVDAATVLGWLAFGEDGSVWVDDASLTRWVDGVEAVIDSVWATRSYVRPDGKWVSVTGGSYGWISNGAELDQIVRDAVQAGTVGQREVPMKQTAAVFNPGGQDWGSRYVDVDLSEQYVRFYDWDGSLIWSSPCISGKPDGHQTPTGVYYVTRKDTNQTLTGPWDPETQAYEYESFVSWWMPFIGNMVGLHDATWQPYFSSDAYLYNGSHGCVNLPYGAAYDLFCLIQVGDVVITHY